MISKKGIQGLMESEQHDLVATVVDADRIVDIVKEQRKQLEEKVENVKSRLWNAERAEKKAKRALEDYKMEVSRVIAKIQTVLDLKYPDHEKQMYGHEYDGVSAAPIAKPQISENLRFLMMLKNDLNSIGNPF